jgi:hypothetical protein
LLNLRLESWESATKIFNVKSTEDPKCICCPGQWKLYE